MIYSSHISWSSPTTPTPLELYPALAFDRLFRDEVGKADKSVLDAVCEDAAGLREQGQHGRPAAARRVPVLASARWNSGSSRRARPAGSRAGGRRSTSPTCRARPTASRRTSTSTCG